MATTSEQLEGFTGNAEAIAMSAIATISEWAGYTSKEANQIIGVLGVKFGGIAAIASIADLTAKIQNGTATHLDYWQASTTVLAEVGWAYAPT